MSKHEHYQATLANTGAAPAFLCGHCGSILSRARIFHNNGDFVDAENCQTIGLCSADDCGAVNCCDTAAAELKAADHNQRIAS